MPIQTGRPRRRLSARCCRDLHAHPGPHWPSLHGFLRAGRCRPQAQAVRYVIDQKQAEVRFSYSLPLSSGVGRFTSMSGTADIDDAALDQDDGPGGHRYAHAAGATSPMAQGELRGADFFDVARYPQMLFKSRSVRPKNATTGEMTGDITVKGITRPIVLHVTLQPPGPGGTRAVHRQDAHQPQRLQYDGLRVPRRRHRRHRDPRRSSSRAVMSCSGKCSISDARSPAGKVLHLVSPHNPEKRMTSTQDPGCQGCTASHLDFDISMAFQPIVDVSEPQHLRL